MQIARSIALLMAVGFFAHTAACGSSDSGSGGGGGASGSGGSGGATGGAGGGTGGGGPGTVAGSCNTTMGFCETYECTSDAACQNVLAGAPTGCQSVGGTWTASAACSTTDSVGSCREAKANGDIITTYYPSSGLTTADAQAACDDDNGTFTAP